MDYLISEVNDYFFGLDLLNLVPFGFADDRMPGQGKRLFFLPMRKSRCCL